MKNMSNLLECIQDCQHIMACYPSMHQTHKLYTDKLSGLMAAKNALPHMEPPSDAILELESMFEHRQHIRKRIDDIRLFTHNYHYVQDEHGRFVLSNIFDQDECVPHFVFAFATTRYIKITEYTHVRPLAEYLELLAFRTQEYEDMTLIIQKAREKYNRVNPDII